MLYVKHQSLLFPVLETVTTRGNYFPSLLGIIELRGEEIRIDIGWRDNCCGSVFYVSSSSMNENRYVQNAMSYRLRK